MPCLLYCVPDPAAEIRPAGAGVRGAAVESVDVNGLHCFYSLVDAVASDAESLKRDALEFHSVTRSLFEKTAIIPFRFPTVLASVAEVDAHLRELAPKYDAALKQFRDMVQMEMRIGLSDAQAADAGSGTEYLKSRAQRGFQLQQAIFSCRVAIDEEVIDWRQRESSHGVRCFVLVKREAVNKVQKQLQQLRLERVVTAAVSGPWPPTEFFPDFA